MKRFSFSSIMLWAGLIFIYLFSVQLGWLPTGQRLDTDLSLQPITGLMVVDSILQGRGDVLINALKHDHPLLKG